MQVPVYNLAAEVVKQIEISDKVFGVPFNEGVVHQAMVRQLANARQGTADTKTRSEVAGTGKKQFRQKGGGRGRMGDRRTPKRVGGGVAFGPHPRSYRMGMPKKMRQLALRCVLSAKAADGQLKVLEDFRFEEPKTKPMAKALDTLGAAATLLLVTGQAETTVVKSARNIPGVKTMPAYLLNVVDVLSHKDLLMTESAVRRAEELWGGKKEEAGDASV